MVMHNSNHNSKQQQNQILFRHLSRQVMKLTDKSSIHFQRIRVASTLQSSEPLQGALADYFYGCWFEIVYDNQQILNFLNDIQHKLPSDIYNMFIQCSHKQIYVNRISKLATASSVLVTPSMDMPVHRLRTSKDNTSYVVDSVISQLKHANEQGDQQMLTDIEDKFFEHCLICSDLVAFMKVWFALNKNGWVLGQRWQDCRTQLEKLQQIH